MQKPQKLQQMCKGMFSWRSERNDTLKNMFDVCVRGHPQGIDTEGILGDIFRGDIIVEVAAKREPGLQLLVMDICDTAESFALPGTLRHLFLSNR